MMDRGTQACIEDSLARWCAAYALLITSCSVVLDTDAKQCSRTEDCAAFEGTLCIDHACVIPAPGTPGECRKNEDCAHRGDDWICRSRDRVCAPLRSPDCQVVSGNYQSDNAVFIGSLLETEGEFESTGRPAQNAIQLALQDLDGANKGLPAVPGQEDPSRRPLVLVGCNSGSDPIAAARHLVEQVRVPAIIGSSFSGVTIQVATEVTIPAQVLLISPSATSAAISQLQDDHLVWRTAPSDNIQAVAIQQLVPIVEDDVRTVLTLDEETPIQLAIAHKSDSYGRGLADTVEKLVTFNGMSAAQNKRNYLRVDYGDPAVPATIALEQAVESLLEQAPHIILLFGTTESITDVLRPIEQRWDAANPHTAHRPRYVFADGGVVDELWAYVGKNDDLRRRILGTIPGTNHDTAGSVFSSFKSRYLSAIKDGTSPDVFGAAGAYDAAYLLMFAFAVIGPLEPTGPHLASGLGALVPPGTTVSPGFGEINDVFKAIADGKSIDYDGASGPLDFDLSTGEARSDIQVWCVPKDDQGAATVAQNSGLYLEATSGTLVGAISNVCD
jgi:branched-chain amino acid transport system substrate-binding protein